ncbi:MAG: phosphotransferase [Cyclobacteriaceae bacterium]
MSEEELIQRLYEIGLIQHTQDVASRLSGGVSCLILLIDDGTTRFVVKSALEKLNVKEDWFADLGRNKTEQEYLSYVGEFLPEAVPKVIYSDNERHFFCMEMLENDLSNWKQRLMAGQCDLEYARRAGVLFGTIHKKSAGDKNAQHKFDTLNNFYQLRIEPYLLRTGQKHPELEYLYQKEAERLASTSTCLVHGDFSPKNIMVSPDRIVVLDCEVAWYGDPVFDVAFLLNHFMMKAVYKPGKSLDFMEMAKLIWENYKSTAKELADKNFEGKLCHLLCLLMLARVDGKSPVEYLNEQQQKTVRSFVYETLPMSIDTFAALQDLWLERIKN